MRRSRDAYDRSVVSIVVFSGILNIFRGFRSFCGIRQRIHVDCRGIAVDATMLATLQWQAVERHFIRRVFTVAFRGIGNHLDFQTMRLTTPAHRILEFATSQRATPMQRAVGTHHVVIARIPMIDFRLLLTACDGVDNGLLASGLTRIDIGQLRAQRTHVAIVGNRQIHGIPAAMHTAEHACRTAWYGRKRPSRQR